MSDPILILESVRTYYPIHRGVIRKRQVGVVRAVDGVSLTLHEGEVLGLVGESGCGKSTLARTIMHLIPATGGRILMEGRDLSRLSREAIRTERVNFQMIFQDPHASLNPRMTVYDALAEAVRTRHAVRGDQLLARVCALMERVGLSARQIRKYPHEFSGGQRQRIAIARCLAPEPKLIIADEPVSALDVSIQSQILNLVLSLSREMNLTLIFISHDLSVVKYIADRIAVMYLGKLVEIGRADEIMEYPRHPYTRALVSAVPVPDPRTERRRKRVVLSGEPPSAIDPPGGCAFHPRCAYAVAECSRLMPRLDRLEDGRQVACIRVDAID